MILRVSGSVLACFLYKIYGVLGRCMYYIYNRKCYVQEWVSCYKYNMLQLLKITKCCRLADFVLRKYKIIKIIQSGIFFLIIFSKRYPFKDFPCTFNWTVCPYFKHVWFMMLEENFLTTDNSFRTRTIQVYLAVYITRIDQCHVIQLRYM